MLRLSGGDYTMQIVESRLAFFVDEYNKIKAGENSADKINIERRKLPGNTYFLSDGSILCLPRKKGVSRFPYGEDGFNFWTYDSGYMHANEGLFSLFLRAYEGQEPRIAFFAGRKYKEGYKALSLMPVPDLDSTSLGEIDRFTVFDEVAAYYITQTSDFRFCLCVHVNDEKDLNFSLIMQQLNASKKEIYLAWYFNPSLSYALNEDSEQRWFKVSEFFEEDENPIGRFLFSVNEDMSRYAQVSNFGLLSQKLSIENALIQDVKVSTSRKLFVGAENKSLHTATALTKGDFEESVRTTTFSDNAIAGEILQLKTLGRANVQVDLFLNYKIHSYNLNSYKDLFVDMNEQYLEKSLRDQYSEKLELRKRLDASFSDYYNINTNKFISSEIMSNFFTYLKRQVEFCATISGYAQLSENSLIGIRDVFQAIEAYLFDREDLSRVKILEALNFIDPSGKAPRQYSLPVSEVSMPKMDLRAFIDQGLWIINTIVTYLKTTHDFTLLNEICGYYEVLDPITRIVKKSKRKDSVLKHILQILDYLISHIDSETNCLHILYGDWVDALDGLGRLEYSDEYSNGVSVMASLQLYKALGDVVELLRYIGYDSRVSDYYIQIKTRLQRGIEQYAIVSNSAGERKISHGWGENRSYYIGSYNDIDGCARDSLVANAFWVISDMFKVNPELDEAVLRALNNLDSKYGFRTFEPAFAPGTPGVGRINQLPLGTAENGSTYCHGAMFAVTALFKMGKAELAWEQLEKLLPFTHNNLNTSPFVMSNSYAYNPVLNIDGESMLDWQTGSSNVLMKIFIHYVFGLRFEYDHLIIQAANFCPMKKWKISLNYRNKRINLAYENLSLGRRKFRVMNELKEGIRDVHLGVEVLRLDIMEMEEREINIKIID